MRQLRVSNVEDFKGHRWRTSMFLSLTAWAGQRLASPWEQRGDRTHPRCSRTPNTARGARGPCSQGQLPSLLRGQGSGSVPLSARVTNQQHSLLQHSSPVLGLRGRAGAELRAGVTNTRRNWPRAAREPHLIRQTYWRAAISDLQKQSLGCLSSLN